VITSPHNQTIKDLIRLRKKRGKDGTYMVIDGARALKMALDSGVTVDSVFFAESAKPSDLDVVNQAQASGAAISEVADKVFAKMAYGNAPDAIVAVSETPPAALDSLKLPDNPLILVLVEVEKPGNLGALLRTADAAGVNAVIVADPVSDPFGANVVRASRGTLFSVPFAVADGETVQEWLKQRGIPIAAALPGADAAYTAKDLSGPLAITLGAEHDGLSPQWQQASDLSLTIPMAGAADSLNVATSGAVLLYEAVRQRA
jgi:TrmH family RNA methyltransferase